MICLSPSLLNLDNYEHFFKNRIINFHILSEAGHNRVRSQESYPQVPDIHILSRPSTLLPVLGRFLRQIQFLIRDLQILNLTPIITGTEWSILMSHQFDLIL